MEICVLVFARAIYWKLSPVDPLLYEVRSNPGVHFISPLLFPSIEGLMDAKRVHSSKFTFDGYVGGLYLFATTGLAFRVDEDFIEQYKPKDVSRLACYFSAEAPPLIEIATSLLDALRHFSKQADMCTEADDLHLWEWLEVDELPTIAQSESSNIEMSVAKSIFEKAVTRRHIEAACACDSQFKAPIFDTLFLDAIGAHAAHDYRKAILYSAIALESAAAAVLDEQYETKVKSSDTTDWRLITLPIAGGKTVRKDPIWEFLKKRADANSLLHEAALYILGKSLLVENEPLFQYVQRLRATRNKIVHYGEPPEPNADQYLAIDSDGSSEALNCTNAVFAWLGVGQDYKLHGNGFVPLSNVPEVPDVNPDHCETDID